MAFKPISPPILTWFTDHKGPCYNMIHTQLLRVPVTLVHTTVSRCGIGDREGGARIWSDSDCIPVPGELYPSTCCCAVEGEIVYCEPTSNTSGNSR